MTKIGRGVGGASVLANRPERFVSNHQLAGVSSLNIPQGRFHFRPDYSQIIAVLVARRLADAKNHSQLMTQSQTEFVINRQIGVAEGPGLGVTENDKIGAAMLQHRRAESAGVSAERVAETILSAEHQVRCSPRAKSRGQAPIQTLQKHRRRTNHRRHPLQAEGQPFDRQKNLLRLTRRFRIHFPVGDNQFFAHRFILAQSNSPPPTPSLLKEGVPKAGVVTALAKISSRSCRQ